VQVLQPCCGPAAMCNRWFHVSTGSSADNNNRQRHRRKRAQGARSRGLHTLKREKSAVVPFLLSQQCSPRSDTELGAGPWAGERGRTAEPAVERPVVLVVEHQE